MPDDQETRGRPSSQDAGTVEPDALAAQFGDVARILQAEDDTEAMLDELVASAVRMIPGADEASISIVTGRTEVSSQHPTGALPALVDEIQTETGQGPCLDAAYEHRTVRVPDLAHEERWPRFARRAAEAGAGSMLSFQLWVEHDDLGALNLYSHSPDAFDDESEQVGLLFASHAAVAFADARKVDQLERAVGSRDVIGQAKGILMERYGIDDGQAFRVLTRVSQNSHRKLRDVAAELARTRTLPELPS
jgi:transcriptional regulator with GAF, ATPase, and Fis domain